MCFLGIAPLITGNRVLIVLQVVHTLLVMFVSMNINFRSREIPFLVQFPLRFPLAHHTHGLLSLIYHHLATTPTELHILIKLFQPHKFRGWINPPTNFQITVLTPRYHSHLQQPPVRLKLPPPLLHPLLPIHPPELILSWTFINQTPIPLPQLFQPQNEHIQCNFDP